MLSVVQLSYYIKKTLFGKFPRRKRINLSESLAFGHFDTFVDVVVAKFLHHFIAYCSTDDPAEERDDPKLSELGILGPPLQQHFGRLAAYEFTTDAGRHHSSTVHQLDLHVAL